jgi:hypothetical protein
MGKRLTRFEPSIRHHTSCCQLGLSTKAVEHNRPSYPELTFLSNSGDALTINNKFRFNAWKRRSVRANPVFPVIPTLVQWFNIRLATGR